MGGSFNPAHGGHLHLSLLALEQLDLDEVWWLVSPQNPLKPVAGMAPFSVRLDQARRLADGHRRIVVSDLENRLGRSTYTADTLRTLRRRFPLLRFVWLMGADNLVQLRHWQRWREIFRAVPIAVFARPSYSLRALAGLPGVVVVTCVVVPGVVVVTCVVVPWVVVPVVVVPWVVVPVVV